MIDRHLAEMYGVETRILNQAVKRNIKRFPAEFMSQLNREERDEVITICDLQGRQNRMTQMSPFIPLSGGIPVR